MLRTLPQTRTHNLDYSPGRDCYFHAADGDFRADAD